MCENTIDFRLGNQFPDLVLLGACPGQNEFNAAPQRPFAGNSALNLRILFQVLRNLPNKGYYGFQADDFASDNPDDYTLMNSHHAAKWPAEHGLSTPRLSEVDSDDNLVRLRNQLECVEARVVIGLGRPIADANLARSGKDSGPMRAIRNLAVNYPGVSFCITGHPSPKPINRYGGGNAQQWFLHKLRRFP
jgi:uracil-DNA glycosylase